MYRHTPLMHYSLDRKIVKDLALTPQATAPSDAFNLSIFSRFC